MTQTPNSYPPYQPTPYRASNPLGPARRASVLMWVLGVLAVLLGILLAAALPRAFQWMLDSAPAADAEQLRKQMAEVEAVSKTPMATQMYVGGTLMIVAGGVLGALAFPVRRGGRAAAVTAAVFSGLIIGYFMLSLLVAIAINPVQALAGACFTVIPVGLLGLLLAWLIQAARNAPAVAAMQSQPPHTTYGPPADTASFQPRPPPPPVRQAEPFVQGPPPGAQAGLFGPSPFGVLPPPPDEVPGGKFGYATRPPEKREEPPGQGDATS